MDFPFHFGQKSSLLLIFFFNGLVFSLILLRQGIIGQNASSKWLSFLLFLCSMYIAPYMLGYAGWYNPNTITREVLFFIPFMQVLLIGPVIYFYIKSLLNVDFKFYRKDWIHLIPAVLYLIYCIIVFITDKIILDEFYFYADERDKDLKTWYQLAGFVSISFYLIQSLKEYKSYKRVIFNTVSFADSILFKWIQNFLIAFLVLIGLRILFFLFNEQWAEFGSHFWYFLCFSIVFFYIGLNGYANAIKSNVFINEKINNKVAIEVEKSTDNKIDVNHWKQEIEKLIKEERIYLNPKLTLSDVSNILGTNSKNISTTINSKFHMNFNDFINHYRVEDVKEKLKNGIHNQKTLLGIALDSGFNSKATFNRAFKKSTSLSPKDFVEKLT